jgi:Predicted transcriptional regulator
MNHPRLGDAELDIMLILWNGRRAMTAKEVQQGLIGKRDWALSSLMTALERLCAKGFIACDRTAGTNLYTPQVQEEAYRAGEGKTLLEKLYGNSVGSLVASLYAGRVIGEKELSELRRLIDELEGGRN